ncbi:LysM peptidoglycan-binding domain-containing protein [Amycolatopsis jejuensis]|uniref:LysM peptidoglycan-binding domain-containing protein n=1 Tax=Amycolatopsis jejuensis TaxID=330084 RepID=UPI001FDF45B4|nr:LysM peptidoglycan-binding domain-containing protein [Amycolatopsis jejuensis]
MDASVREDLGHAATRNGCDAPASGDRRTAATTRDDLGQGSVRDDRRNAPAPDRRGTRIRDRGYVSARADHLDASARTGRGASALDARGDAPARGDDLDASARTGRGASVLDARGDAPVRGDELDASTQTRRGTRTQDDRPQRDRPADGKLRSRTPVRHIPAAVPANPGRTARDRRGEPVRPPSRARVVAGAAKQTTCGTGTVTRPSVRWPWLVAIAVAACLVVTGLGIFGAGTPGGAVPSQTASVSVQPGDSLHALAARFAPDADQGAVVARIKELNGLDDSPLLPGMPLTVPVAWSGGSGS